MYAAVIREFGGPEVLRYEEVPTPQPGHGEVLIRVRAVTVNRNLDLTVRAGKSPWKIAFPHVLGSDPSGIVEAVGEGVSSLQPGNKVTVMSQVPCNECAACLAKRPCSEITHIGVESWGGYAEFVCVKERQAFRVPDDLDFATASYISRHYGMAKAQVDTSGINAGDTALVMGAAGALGTMLVQILAMQGVTVIGAAGNAERVAHGVAFGAHHGVDYRAQDLEKEVMEITGGKGVAVVFENIGDPDLWPGAFNSLGVDGRLITAGYHGGGTVPLDVRRLHFKRLSILPTLGPILPTKKDLADLIDMAVASNIQAPIGARIPLAEASRAHEIVAASGVPGKVVIEP